MKFDATHTGQKGSAAQRSRGAIRRSTAPTANALRQRRYRDRRRRGVWVLQVEIDPLVLAELVKQGRIHTDDIVDEERFAFSIGELLAEIASVE